MVAGFPFSSQSLILVGGLAAFVLTYLCTFVVIAVCRKKGWVEPVKPGKIHTKSLPRVGGLAIFVAFLLISLGLYVPILTTSRGMEQQTILGHAYPKELIIYVLFILASILIVAVHVYDDVKGLKPLPKLIAQTVAVLIVIGPGFHTFHGVLFFGVDNPFVKNGTLPDPALPWYQQPVLTLFIRQPVVTWLALPAVLLTWFWFTGMMNAINFVDGLDGLAGGIVTIAGLFICIISWTMRQDSIALLAAIFTGAVAGFLPHNWHPSRIIMGDSGSQFLGMALAMLAVMGGAKFALMLMIMGIPILDIVVVVVNRMLRGQHPMQRDLLPLHRRKTHLHYRLLYGGLSTRQVCYVLYSATFALGLSALYLPRLYKFVGFALVMGMMFVLLRWSTRLQERREAGQETVRG
jgi:UDP-GlcNAc:undecaprenyl-phosphate GlcNAc-1-phosphate transferase